jgi:peptidyl-prolyl cis-trans isomerase SurA
VGEILDNVKLSQNLPEYRISELLVGIDRPEREEEARQLAERLTDQIRQGADFGLLARQFSDAASAAVAGDIGWVLDDQLDPIVDQAIASLKPGDIAGPIRTPSGFYIVQLVDRRILKAPEAEDATVELRQATIEMSASLTSAERAEREKLAENLSGAASCGDFETTADQAGLPGPRNLGRLKIAELNAALKPAVASLGAGKATQPIATAGGVTVLMVCHKTEPPSMLPTRESIREQLLREKVGVAARRYLRDLRRAANVDIRA